MTINKNKKLLATLSIGVVFSLAFAKPVLATIIKPAPADYISGIFQLLIILLTIVGFLHSLLWIILAKLSKKKAKTDVIRIIKKYLLIIFVFVGLLILIVVLKPVFGKNSWFYRFNVVSMFCPGDGGPCL